MNIVVAPQINVQVGLNLAVLSPGAQQTLGQVAGNTLGATQGSGAGAPAAAGGQGLLFKGALL
jgi:hypothetical protein